jgi:hypothetical protein
MVKRVMRVPTPYHSLQVPGGDAETAEAPAYNLEAQFLTVNNPSVRAVTKTVNEVTCA